MIQNRSAPLDPDGMDRSGPFSLRGLHAGPVSITGESARTEDDSSASVEQRPTPGKAAAVHGYWPTGEELLLPLDWLDRNVSMAVALTF
mgnify:CR=1 FL=1